MARTDVLRTCQHELWELQDETPLRQVLESDPVLVITFHTDESLINHANPDGGRGEEAWAGSGHQ